MGKNIVICCDGTGNEFGACNSNVVKLFGVLDIDPDRQVAYYDPGLGVMADPRAFTWTARKMTMLLGKASGWGIAENIGDAYAYLMQTYVPGDRLFLFGFSRGAYTVRAIAALLHMAGLLPKNQHNLVPYVVAKFRYCSSNADEHLLREFGRTFCIPCKTHFVGVWDTVSSVGWLTDPVKLRYTTTNPDIAIGRHALAIDERRAFFRQNRWGNPAGTQSYKQVWFAGVHSDIGGGYPEAESGLSKIALEWMMGEAGAAGLGVIPARVHEVLGYAGRKGFVKPDAAAEQHNSLKRAWRMLEYIPKPRWDEENRRRWRVYRGKARTIPEGSALHESVIERLKLGTYKPPNLPKKYDVEPWVRLDTLGQEPAVDGNNLPRHE